MGRTGDDDSHWERERDVDRAASREPSKFRRRRVPQHAYKRNPRLGYIAAGLDPDVELGTAGVLQPPVKVPVVPPEPEWSPYRSAS